MCIGDMDMPITILSRTLKSTGVLDVDYTESFERVADMWAALQTVKGVESFNGVGHNTEGQVTHKFYIRNIEDCGVTSENWVQCGSDYFRIMDVENLDGRDEFIVLSCVKHGSKDLEANHA